MAMMQHADGHLSLQFEYSAQTARTLLNIHEQRQPLKVVRAFHLDDGAALVHVHNLSGGVLAGDRLSLEVNVGPGARAQVTSTSATRLYRSRPQALPAQFSTSVRVAANALLEYLPDPLIPFAGSRYSQRTVVNLEPGAGLFWWDTVAPGREARDEIFSYDSLRLGFELHAAGVPIAIERSDLHPIERPLSSPARLGPYRYFSSFYICRSGVAEDTWRVLENGLRDLAGNLTSPVIIWGLGRLPAHGLVVRALSHNGRDIAQGLVAFWRAAKQALYGQDAVIPRKIY
jgi:urease accessory protein